MNESRVTPANHYSAGTRRKVVSGKRGGVKSLQGCRRLSPFARALLNIGHILLPCQIRPVFSLEEVSVRCCAAVVAGQMDQHMAWPLLFRCRVCCVTLNEAQVHIFKSFTGQYGNVYRLLLCPLYFITSFPKECVCFYAMNNISGKHRMCFILVVKHRKKNLCLRSCVA